MIVVVLIFIRPIKTIIELTKTPCSAPSESDKEQNLKKTIIKLEISYPRMHRLCKLQKNVLSSKKNSLSALTPFFDFSVF